MALADIKQRPGIVLGVAVVLHVAIISAQVNTATGMPLLRARDLRRLRRAAAARDAAA